MPKYNNGRKKSHSISFSKNLSKVNQMSGLTEVSDIERSKQEWPYPGRQNIQVRRLQPSNYVPSWCLGEVDGVQLIPHTTKHLLPQVHHGHILHISLHLPIERNCNHLGIAANKWMMMPTRKSSEPFNYLEPISTLIFSPPLRNAPHSILRSWCIFYLLGLQKIL